MPADLTSLIQRLQAAARELLDEPALAVKGRLSALQRFAHFWVIVVRSFIQNRCPLRASALSYITLLSLVPMLAVVLGITSSLLKGEGEAQIERFIEGVVNTLTPPAIISEDGDGGLAFVGPPLPWSGKPSSGDEAAGGASPLSDERALAAQRQVAQKINEFIQNTRSGTLGAVGTVVLLITILTLMTRIEETMNDIWGVTRPRSWMERIEHYWFAVSLGPLLIASGLTLASGPQVTSVRMWIESTPFVGGLVFKWLPITLLWMAFSGFYKLMPATRVTWSAAALGGAFAAVCWFGTNVLGSLYVSRVVTNFKIYGSLGLVPVFMIGMYISWLLLLLGAQIAYAFQNREAYLQERLAENVNQRGREFVALRLMTTISQRFQLGQPPASVRALSSELGVPGRLVQQIMGTLLAARLVVEVNGRDLGYVPGRPLNDISCHDVLRAMRVAQGQELATRDEPVRGEVLGEFARIEAAEKNAAASVTMLALAHRATALEIAPPENPAIPLRLQPVKPEPHSVAPPTSPGVDEPAPAEEAPPASAPEPTQPPQTDEPAASLPIPPSPPQPPKPAATRPKPSTVQPSEQPFPD